MAFVAMYSFAVIFWLLASHTGHALKCHVCSNLAHADCLNVTKSEDDRFLKDCPSETTECGLKVSNVVSMYVKVFRACVSKDWNCKTDCHTCHTDGCNYGNEIKTASGNQKLAPSTTEIIKANIYRIGAIVLVVVLLVVWCVSRACSRDNSEYDEDEEDDYEYDEYNEKSF